MIVYMYLQYGAFMKSGNTLFNYEICKHMLHPLT